MSKQAPEWLWAGTRSPTRAGWYPILKCWDQSEGMFPDGGYWNGVSWSLVSPTVMHFIDEECGNVERAKNLARQYDPEW